VQGFTIKERSGKSGRKHDDQLEEKIERETERYKQVVKAANVDLLE